MQTSERSTQWLLTILTAAFVIDVGARLLSPGVAQASGALTCVIERPVEVRGTLQIDTFGKPIAIKADRTLPVEVKR